MLFDFRFELSQGVSLLILDVRWFHARAARTSMRRQEGQNDFVSHRSAALGKAAALRKSEVPLSQFGTSKT